MDILLNIVCVALIILILFFVVSIVMLVMLLVNDMFYEQFDRYLFNFDKFKKKGKKYNE